MVAGAVCDDPRTGTARWRTGTHARARVRARHRRRPGVYSCARSPAVRAGTRGARAACGAVEACVAETVRNRYARARAARVRRARGARAARRAIEPCVTHARVRGRARVTRGTAVRRTVCTPRTSRRAFVLSRGTGRAPVSAVHADIAGVADARSQGRTPRHNVGRPQRTVGASGVAQNVLVLAPIALVTIRGRGWPRSVAGSSRQALLCRNVADQRPKSMHNNQYRRCFAHPFFVAMFNTIDFEKHNRKH